MVNRLFVDTWGWVSLRNKRETFHQDVVRFYNQFMQHGDEVHTTDYVLDETITLLYSRYPRSALVSMRELLSLVNTGRVQLTYIDDNRFMSAIRLRERYDDKPNISFTDLTSMVVMQEIGITQILSGDAHFTHVGLGFALVP
jgi:uncharacterized protein